MSLIVPKSLSTPIITNHNNRTNDIIEKRKQQTHLYKRCCRVGVSSYIPRGHKKMVLSSYMRRGLRRKRLRLPPPHVIICDVLGTPAMLRSHSCKVAVMSLLCAARSSSLARRKPTSLETNFAARVGSISLPPLSFLPHVPYCHKRVVYTQRKSLLILKVVKV